MAVLFPCKNPECTQVFIPLNVHRKHDAYYCSRTCYYHDRRRFVEERFWAKVHKAPEPDGCWEWTGARHKFGYGKFQLGTKQQVPSYRFAYERYIGPIPSGMSVCHRCDNPPCCRPDHLFLGTQSDNIQDAYNKGRIKDGFKKAEKNHQAKLTNEQVMFIKQSRDTILGINLAKMFDVHPGTIYAIWNNRAWISVTDI